MIGELRTELTDDPLGRGYSGMEDAEAAADINTVYRQLPRASMSGDEILQAVDNTEYAGLTEHQHLEFWGLLGLGQLDPFGKAQPLIVSLFGAGSATVAALAEARTSDVSRGVELGIGHVREGNVTEARS